MSSLVRSFSLSLLAAALLAPAAEAQSSGGAFGILLGFSSSTLTDVPDVNVVGDEKRMPSFAAGVSFTVHSTANLSWRTELLYSRKGFRYLLRDSDEYYRYHYSGHTALDYLEMPLMAQLSIPVTGSISSVLLAGPAISVLLGCSYRDAYRIEGSQSDLDETRSGRCSEPADAAKLTGVDFGVILGGGIGFRSVSLQARYNAGLSNVVAEVGGPTIRNRALTLVATMSMGGK